ncbi:hypothetical protein CRI77_04120 [Mycolicibacterium duvalii]|nr:hypothetical protein [Mycolicibacterium duvalii]PEG43853.1 hypothetical protein CRI77_04120 [Mycolicibacterium duvalii]
MTSAGRPRHVRKSTTKYATHVGRVGALAVSLGIGFAIANSATPVAYAETDADSSSSSTSSSTAESATGERSEASKPSVRSGPRVRADRSERAEARARTESRSTDAALDEADVDEDVDAAASGADELDQSSSTAPDNSASEQLSVSETDEVTETVDEQAVEQDLDTEASPSDPTGVVETATTTVQQVFPRRAEVRTAAYASVTSEARVTREVTADNVVAAVVSTAMAPLVDTDAPVSNPINDAVLAWVRRLINHTFFNKTPVVHSVTTEQLLGSVIIDIDAEDPNGDPLTYDIVQPEGGFVVREILTGKFIYTPTVPVIGDPKPVEFQVVIRDDSEHLTGALGAIQNLLHSVARAFGLAQPDTLTYTVNFDVEPILQTPPGLVAIGSLPYQLGEDPVKLLSVAEIIDPDSESLKRAVLKFTVGYQDGDRLEFVAPEGSAIQGSWDEEGRALTLLAEGGASLAAFEAALKAVTFSATDLGFGARTVGITLTDEHDKTMLIPATVLATVLPAVKLPPTLIAAPGLPYRLGDDPTRLLSIAEVGDPDSADLSRVVLKILNARTGDLLEFVAPDGSPVEGEWDAQNHTLTLGNVASKAAYEAALKAVTFSATELGLLSRTVEITVTDQSGTENLVPALVLIGVVASPELPLTVVPVGLPFYTLGKPPVKIVSSVGISNADDNMLSGATVTVSAARLSGDKLVYTGAPTANITVTQTNDYTLTLSGAASVAEYEQVFKQIAFSATQLGVTRTVSITVSEADGGTNPVPGLVLVNTLAPLAPTIAAPSLVPATYTIGKRGVVLAPTVLIGDLDSTNLTKATLKIGLGKQAGDKLTFTTIEGNPITATWNGNDTLTLQGLATIEQYRAALQSVTFEATGGAVITRFVSIDVTDDSGVESVLPASAEVFVKNPDRPALIVTGPSLFEFPKANQNVRPITSATIIDTDSTVLTGASVKITGGFTTGDTLSFAGLANNPVTGSFNGTTRELTLTGTATLGQYKAALEAVTFRATQHGAGWLELFKTRTLTINITDDSGLNALLPGTVLVSIYK